MKFRSLLLWTVWGLLWGIVANLLPAQQPAYFILGEDEFKGLQIYDVIQDQQDNYLISTNEGIYYYDYQHFTRIGCIEAKSNSVFNFVADPDGTVYCCNLNHQIFRIRNKECQLLYELRDDEVSSDISLALGPNHELLASAKKVIAIDSEGNAIRRFAYSTTHCGQPFTLQSGAVVFHLPGLDSLIVAGLDGFATQKISGLAPPDGQLGVLSYLRIDGQSYAIDLASKALYDFDERRFTLRLLPRNAAFERSKSLRIYGVGDKIWIAGTLPGAFHLDKPLQFQEFPLFYENYFISDVFRDREGNTLLSTFDNGILVVPDLAIPDVIQSFRDDPVTALYMNKEGGELYLGTSKGRLLQYRDKKITPLNSNEMRAIECMVSKPGFPYLLYDDGAIWALDKRTGESVLLSRAVLKDAAIVSSQIVYLATNLGLMRCEWSMKGKPLVTQVQGFNFRTHLLEVQSQDNRLITSTSHGLFSIDSNGVAEKILLDGQDIFPTAMAASGDQILAATQNDGILILQGSKISGRIWPKNDRLEVLRKLYPFGNTILAKSSHAIYQFDRNGEVLKNISKVYGFPESRVFDFDLEGDRMWVSHAGGVQSVELSTAISDDQIPELRLAAIKVNDQSVPPGSKAQFGSDQRKFWFALALPSLRYKESVRFYYQLQGYDENWTVKPNDGSEIVYNALAPGTYTFLAKAENQGKFSPTISYQFSIAAPFYSQLWFILLCGLAFVGLVVLVFRQQLAIQRKKARQVNELNASKLTAIQSQMNPHFIFNALNSIQDLVLKGDVENSYSYITTFSNLVRSTLNYSEKDFIDFDQEIKLLNLYLSLEQLRFKKKLVYEIDADDIDDIQLPPLLIQPFVENALVHGLLHKEGEKRLTIRFELREALICTVEDNGIGRERSKAIKERQRSEHESFSGKAIRKRFDILSDVFQGEFGYQYEDLMENGQATGTRITLTIPVKRNF